LRLEPEAPPLELREVPLPRPPVALDASGRPAGRVVRPSLDRRTARRMGEAGERPEQRMESRRP
ncbi:MAG TPA: hypothetical protein VFZ11_03505, partial [Gemmatimonadaceae bacterium]